jgi:murein DD-endopeptidase MepM/ murein hydrolase activator NlpD
MQGQQEAKRKRTPRRFDVVVVPSGEGSRPLRFWAGWWRIGLATLAIFGVSAAITLAILMFTPAMEYLPIPNPAMEARYGRQLLETQQQLQKLAEDVIVMREYNTNLRHALGQENGQGPVVEQRDSVSRQQNMTPPQALTRGGPTHVQASSADDLVEVQQQTGSVPSNPPIQSIPATAMVDYNVAPQARRLELPLLLPVEGFVSQGYDLARRHFGLDIAAKRGSPVQSPADGYVVYAGWTYEDGNTLVLSHGSGYLTVFKHNQTLLTTVASPVRRGEVIALLGSSGRTSQGPHLHFEVWKDGIPRDPNELLMTPARMQ